MAMNYVLYAHGLQQKDVNGGIHAGNDNEFRDEIAALAEEVGTKFKWEFIFN